MKSYVLPTKEYDNDIVILHCGTNDLRGNKEPKDIANEIGELALSIKTVSNDIMISGIVPRRDSLHEKGKKVNEQLKVICREKNMHFIDNTNISPYRDLNSSGLHLNFEGTYVLGGNLVDAIRL